MEFRKRIDKEKAFQKIKHYCAYQERCHQEVKEKLYGMGLYKNEVEELVARLICDDYLNEERFACQFAGGKFRMKNWGRKKIEYELKKKNVSAYCIRKAMKEIPEEDYRNTLLKLAGQKASLLQNESLPQQRQKLKNHLLMKGYEYEIVDQLVKDLRHP